jgi:hypothetical protein
VEATMGYEACGLALDDLLDSLDDDEKSNNGKLSQKTKNLRDAIRSNLKNPKPKPPPV